MTGHGRSTGRTTLAAVAAQAGVSTMTASRALNHPDQVSEPVRARVRSAAAALGYVPNRAARALASSRSHLILALVPSLSNAVFAELLEGIQQVLEPGNYQLLIGNTHYSDLHEEKLLAAYLQSSPDGILLCGSKHSPGMKALLASCGVPVVSMMDLSDQPGELSVGFSQVDAGRAMTEHLLARGRTRIVFAGAQLDERTLRRADGYRLAMQAAGRADPALELMVPQPSNVALGATLLDTVLARQPNCDAIFFCNDDLAHGALFRCQRLGIGVPERLAIAGFNDLPASALMQPALTTVATPRFQVGWQAATLLLDRVEGRLPAARRIDLGFTVMARESS